VGPPRPADVERLTAGRNWAMQAGDMYNQRYSQLKQVNRDNVGKLQVAGPSPPACCAAAKARHWWSTA
jgi:glucose dehydrogenase